MSSCSFGNCDSNNIMGSMNMNRGMGGNDFSFPSSYDGNDNDFSPFSQGPQITVPTTNDIPSLIPTNQQTLTKPIEPVRSQMVNNPPQMGPNVPIYNPVNSSDIDPERALNSLKHTNILDLPNNRKQHLPVTSAALPNHQKSNISIDSIRSEVKDSLKDSYLLIMKNINLALVLIAALAWNDAVKYYIARMIKFQKGSPYYYLYYALIVTLLAVLSVRLTHKFL